MNSVDKAFASMIENLYKNTGKTLEQWIEIVSQKDFSKHGEIVNFLKSEYTIGHGFANLIAHKSKGTDAGSADSTNELIEKQYKGKEHFRPVYEKLMTEILKFGNDIEVSPKNAYVSLRRKKQFALLQPATKTRFEILLIIKGQEAKGVLEIIPSANAMCSHRINIEKESDITAEVLNWIKVAFDKAG